MPPAFDRAPSGRRRAATIAGRCTNKAIFAGHIPDCQRTSLSDFMVVSRLG